MQLDQSLHYVFIALIFDITWGYTLVAPLYTLWGPKCAGKPAAQSARGSRGTGNQPGTRSAASTQSLVKTPVPPLVSGATTSVSRSRPLRSAKDHCFPERERLTPDAPDRVCAGPWW